jgi:hypothetical protein
MADRVARSFLEWSRQVLSFVKANGLRHLLVRIRNRFTIPFYERKFGVRTRGPVSTRELGVQDPNANSYESMGYDDTFWALDKVPFRPEDVVFIDYGAGKGRALVAATTRPFKRVIGVEHSELLAQIARNNLTSMRHRRGLNKWTCFAPTPGTFPSRRMPTYSTSSIPLKASCCAMSFSQFANQPAPIPGIYC